MRRKQAIEGVDDIRDGYNPATWVLEVTNGASERKLNKDFADEYEASSLYKCVLTTHNLNFFLGFRRMPGGAECRSAPFAGLPPCVGFMPGSYHAGFGAPLGCRAAPGDAYVLAHTHGGVGTQPADCH